MVAELTQFEGAVETFAYGIFELTPENMDSAFTMKVDLSIATHKAIEAYTLKNQGS